MAGKEQGGGFGVPLFLLQLIFRLVLVLGAVGVCDVEAQLPPVPEGATAVAQGLFGPRGMKFGPEGALYVLYVSNWGAAAAPIGQILRFNVN